MSNFITRYKKQRHAQCLSDFMPVVLISLVILIFGFSLIRFYYNLTTPNVTLQGKSSAYLYIPTHSDFESVKYTLVRQNYLHNLKSFDWASNRMQYGKHIMPGKYRVYDGMSNRQLIQILRSGIQEPVKLILTGARNEKDLAGKVGHLLEPDSAKFMRLFHDSSFLLQFGVKPATVLTLFIPDTYEFYWNTSAASFIKRMVRERQRFWHGRRLKTCDSIGFSNTEVYILASIIEKETVRSDEKPVIAGVYINRIKRHIPLQADPTIIFAWNDYRIKRVLNNHLKINSPFNTYKYAGLPPGPICIPSISSIDAVLRYQRHRFLYFCANEDFSGYHRFSSTLAEHNRNARKYQEALDKLKIK